MNQSNVHPISAAQPAPACRFSIQVVISGFPVELAGETSNASNLLSLIEKLRAVGAEPPKPTSQVVGLSEPAKAAGPPLCPTHHKSKPSKRPGSFYCPASDLDTGEYCRWTGKA